MFKSQTMSRIRPVKTLWNDTAS